MTVVIIKPSSPAFFQCLLCLALASWTMALRWCTVISMLERQRTVLIRCDLRPITAMSILSLDTKEAEVIGEGRNTRRSMNFTSRCACAGGCPRGHDHWARGPVQRDNEPGTPVAYPSDYPGRIKQGDSYIGKGISRIQCNQACDGATPACTVFTYSAKVDSTYILHGTTSCDTTTTPGGGGIGLLIG